MNFISGETFQEIADVTIALNVESNYDSELVKTQLKTTNTKLFVFSENDIIDKLPEDIKNAKIIFVYTHILEYFFSKIFPKIETPIVLISHNSDHGIDERFLTFLSSNKLKKWYCQNRCISHPKLFSLPIGLGNKQWEHGNINLLKTVINKNNIKTNLVYKNFDIATNIAKRKECIEKTNWIPFANRTSIENYWEEISRSAFSIAPHGNGIDCHRIWECLYLKTVPIVQYNECFSQFKHLPILYVEDWSEISINFLREKYLKYEHFNLDILELNVLHWKNVITC